MVFSESISLEQAAGLLKAYLCVSCLVWLQGSKDKGAIQLAALSVMQGEEPCCTGCAALAALRNWSCVYLLLVVGCIFQNGEKVFSPRLLVHPFEIWPVASEGEWLVSGEVNKRQNCAICKLCYWCSICICKCCQNRLPIYPYMALLLVRAENTSYFCEVHL